MKDFLMWDVGAKPTPYGLYWLVCTAILLCGVVLTICYARKIPPKYVGAIFVVAGALCILSEITKQFAVSLRNGDGVLQYSFMDFPFQPSSVTMYCIFLVGIVKDGWLKNALGCYIATYGLFGGLAAFALPQAVLNTTSAITLFHTMFLHGIMLLAGVFVITTTTAKLDNKFWCKAFCVFLVCAAIATIINFCVHWFTQDSAGMFFIDPFSTIHLPIVGDIADEILANNKLLWLVYIPLFLCVYSLFVYGLMQLCKLIKNLFEKKAMVQA